MNNYDGCYVKASGDPTFWAVDGGERRIVKSMSEVYAIGLRRVVTISQEELDALPIAGQQRRRKKVKAIEADSE